MAKIVNILDKYTSENNNLFATDAPYEVLIQLPFGKTVIEHYYDIWEKLGFIDENDPEPYELAMAYTNLAYFCLYDYRHNEIADKLLEYDLDLEVVGFPMIKQILKKASGESFFNFEKFIFMLRHLNIDMDAAIDSIGNDDVDFEAVLVSTIADVIGEQLEVEGDKYRHKHDLAEYNYYGDEEDNEYEEY